MTKFRVFTLSVIAVLMCAMTVPAYCQSEGDSKVSDKNKEVIIALEQVAGQLNEQLGEQLGGQVEEIVKSVEGLVAGQDEEMAKWAEEHAAKWEEWAKRFEAEMGTWAQKQEGVWEEWAEKYGQKMEKWGERAESGELSPEEMSEMIERNIEMIGEMPLGQMIDGLMKKGAGELKGAPWDSLQGLEGMIQKSVERAVQQAEKEAASVGKAAAGEWAKQKLGEHKLEAILPIVEKLQENLETRSFKLDGEVADKLKMLKEQLGNGKGIDGDAIKGMVEKMLKQRMKMAEGAEGASSDAADKAKNAAKMAYEKAMEKYSEHQKARKAKGQKPGPDVSAILNKIRTQKDGAKKRVVEELRRVAEAEGKTQTSGKAVEKLYRTLGKERKRIESKEDELSALRAEIEKLRSDIRKMKKDQD